MAASAITTSGATLNGTANANGLSTTITFDYGATTGYGTNVGATTGSPATGTGNTNTTYTLSGQNPNTLVHFRVDGTNTNGTVNGGDMSFYTLANVPSAPTVNGATSASLNVTINVNSNPAITTFAIYETSTGKFVQANGSLGASPVWQTAATWGAITVTGLTASTTYTFEAEAENGASVTTAFSSGTNGTTLAASGPTITTTPASFGGPFCNNTTQGISVAFSSTGNLTGNFYVQISNSTGSFTNTTNTSDPTIIGTGTSPISATIPSGLAVGTGYRVRVINSNPWTYGTDNGTSFTINAPPTSPTFTAATSTNNDPTPCVGLSNNYTITPQSGYTYSWTVPVGWGTVTGGTTNQITVTPNSASGQVIATVSIAGCANANNSLTVTPSSVSPTVTIDPASPTVCGGTAATITASGASTYVWSANAGSATTAQVSVSPGTATNYSVTGTALNGCTGSANVTVNVNSTTSTVTATAYPSTVCSGVSSSLTATVTAPGGTIADGGAPNTYISNYKTYPSAFPNYDYQSWQQFLYLGSEFTTAGMTTGEIINSIAFDVESTDGYTSASGYTISLEWVPSSTTSLSAFQTTGLIQVYTGNYGYATNWNTINFSNSFPPWDGSSNLLVDVRMTGSGSSGNNAYTYYSTTTNNTTVYSYSTSNNSSYYTSGPSPTAISNRPIIQLGLTQTQTPSAYLWSTGATTSPVSVSPSTNTTYNCSVTVSGCQFVSNNVTVNYTTGGTASNPQTANCSGGTTTVSWTNPTCLTDVLVVANQGSSVTFTPSGTSYSGNTVYGGANQVVYFGSGSSVAVTGLTNGQEYTFEIYTLNGSTWSAGVSTNCTPTTLTIPGNLLINVIGNGSTTLSGGNAINISLIQAQQNGSVVSTIPVPATASGSNYAMVASNSATSDGEISLSVDGTKSFFGGYNNAIGTSNVINNAGGYIVGYVDNGAINTATQFNTSSVFPSNNFRGVCADGSNIWGSGQNGMAYIAQSGNSAGTTLSGSFGSGNSKDVRWSNIFTYLNSNATLTKQLFVSSGAGTQGIYSVGTGETTTGSPALTAVETSGLSSPYGFIFFSSGALGATYDLLYVIGDGGDGLNKYYYNGTSWSSKGWLSGSGRGLTGYLNSSGHPVLFFTDGSGSNLGSNVYTYTDATSPSTSLGSGSSSYISVSTLLYTAGTDYAVRGISFTPTSITQQPSNQSACAGTNTSFSVTMASGSGASYNYQWFVSTNSGSTWASISNGGVYSGATTSTLSLTGVTSGMTGYEYECVITYMSEAYMTSNAATLSVITSATPVVGVITQPTCAVPTGSVALSGLPSSGNWTLTPSSGSPIVGSGTSYTATGLTAGTTYTYTVTNSSNCVSSATGNVVINSVPALPTITSVTPTQPTCAVPTGSIAILPSSASNQYSIDNGGTFISTTGSFSGIAPSTSANIKVRLVADNTCVTTYASNPVAINAVPALPTITSVTPTQPTCAVPTVSIVILPSSASNQYSIDNGTTFTNTTGSFSGIAPSTSANIKVRLVADNTCVTTYASNPVAINAVPALPTITSVTPTQPTCAAPTGSIVILPSSASNQYSIDNGTTFTNTTGSFSGIAPSTSANIKVRLVADNTCVTTYASNPVAINAVPALPTITSVTPTQPTCAVPTGSIVILPSSASNQYSIDNGTTFTNTSGSFSGIAPSTNANIKVRLVADNTCVTTWGSNPVVINAVPTLPTITSVTPTQPTCAVPTGSIVILPSSAADQYSIDNGTTFTNTTGSFTGIAPSTNTNIKVTFGSGLYLCKYLCQQPGGH